MWALQKFTETIPCVSKGDRGIQIDYIWTRNVFRFVSCIQKKKAYLCKKCQVSFKNRSVRRWFVAAYDIINCAAILIAMLLDFERPRSSSKCKKYIIRWICRILPYDQIKTMKKLNSKSASFINFPFWFDCTMMFDIWNFTSHKFPVLCLIFGICAIFEWRLRSGLRRYEGFQHFEIDSHTKKNRNTITFRFSWLCYTETMPYVSLNIPFSWIFTLGWNLKKYAVLCSDFEKNLRTVPVYFFLPRLLHFFFVCLYVLC